MLGLPDSPAYTTVFPAGENGWRVGTMKTIWGHTHTHTAHCKETGRTNSLPFLQPALYNRKYKKIITIMSVKSGKAPSVESVDRL